MTTKNTYQIIEDNGGNLYLFVFSPSDDVIGGIENLEYADAGEYRRVRDGLNADPLHEIGGWDGHMDDPQGTYDHLTSYEYGWQVVCDDGTLYPDRMGAAAYHYFSASYIAASVLGSIKTKKKARASRENGKLGGRPKKLPLDKSK